MHNNARRPRGRTVSMLDAGKRGASSESLFGQEKCWSGGGGGGDESGSSSGSASGSDSAYGTPEESSWGATLKRKGSGGRTGARLRSTRSRSAGSGWTQRDGLFALEVDYAHESSSSEDSSTSTFPSTPSNASSRRSSPATSECEFFPSAELATPPPLARSNPFSSVKFLPPPSLALSRRHTIPRRKRIRRPSISISFVSPTLVETSSSTLADPLDLIDSLPTLQPVALTATILTTALSLASLVFPFPLLPSSPAHLLHSRGHLALEVVNAALSPFLVMVSPSSLALGVANLACLYGLEREGTGGSEMAGLWSAIVGVRVLLAWVFGRVLGWAHPSLFSTQAIHQVGAGLAPLLLALHLLDAYRTPKRDAKFLSFEVTVLAANFSTPIEHGGTGLWWGLSAVCVGALACLVHLVYQTIVPYVTSSDDLSASSKAFERGKVAPSSAYARWSTLLPLLILPFLAFSPTPTSTSVVNTAFSSLHISQPHLLTILLMTAPRPGNPDFLVKTVESWLGALPSPSSTSPLELSLSPRLRLIVYTHFKTHDVFDSAETFFSSSPAYAKKAKQYIEWHRDPRGSDRLDQRLHVARGLQYASRAGGESAYVFLAEDDFPLCPNGAKGEADRWTDTWDALKRALVSTNELMPDFPPSPASPSLSGYAAQEASAGHCGLFLATGGSGLAVRGFIAARLPALLLGADDVDGFARDARASAVRKEDEGADTPDLVIQDCLRGRVKGCEVCAPDPGRRWPAGSWRSASVGARGDRWGKSGLAGTERLLQMHLGYNSSTLPGRKYGKEEWACGWRQPFNGEPDVLTV